MDAIAAERCAAPGDMASPGNIMLKIFDPHRGMTAKQSNRSDRFISQQNGW